MIRQTVLHAAAAMVFLLGVASFSHAGFIDVNLEFETVENQSLWNDANTAQWEQSGEVGSSASVDYSVAVLDGKVSVNFDGTLRASYDDVLTSPGPVGICLDFTGWDNGGLLSTEIGYWIKSGYDVDVSVDLGILGSYGVDRSGSIINLTEDIATISKNFNSSINNSPVESSVSMSSGDLLPLDLRVLDIGFKYNIIQDVSFQALSIEGVLNFKHEDASTWQSMPFSLTEDTGEFIYPDLDMEGFWEFNLSDISLVNTFESDIRYQIDPSIEVDFGVWDKSWDWDIDGNMYDQDAFSLAFQEFPVSSSFSVRVDSVIQPVPEPAGIVLTMMGLLCVTAWYSRLK